MTLTTSWKEVVKKAPYDIIMLYDVLDHIEGPVSNIAKELKNIKSILRPGGSVYVRCHPFCSRHGTHLYQKINKAFIHLIFTEEELEKLGYGKEFQLPTRKIIHPIITYNEWFKTANFQLYKRDHVYREAVEPFFENIPLVAKRIKDHWKDSSDKNLKSGKGFPRIQLEQQFVDYILK